MGGAMRDFLHRRLTRRTLLERGTLLSLGAVLASSGSSFAQPAPRDELRLSFTSLGTEALDSILGPNNNLPYLDLVYDAVVGNNYKATGVSQRAGLAKSWSVSPDSRTFTFQLRQWKFHNGDAVTAEDVVFSVKRLGGPRDVSPLGRQVAANLDSVTATGPSEVTIKLKNPTPAFLVGIFNEMTDVSSLVVPMKYFEKVGQDVFALNPVGSGPYKIVRHQVGALIQLQPAYPEHYAIGKPRFNTVTMRIVADENTRISQLKTGAADFIDVAATSVPALVKAGFHAYPRKTPDDLMIVFQSQKSSDPTSDINLRKALAYAINRDEMNKQLMSGLGTVTGEWMAGQIGLKPVPAIPYDLQMAKAFLAKTPYGPGGQTLTMQLQIPNRDGWPQMLALGQAVQGYWKAISVDTNIINQDWGTMRAQWVSHTLPSPTAIMFNLPGVVAWLPNASVFMGCAGVLSAVCDPHMQSLLEEWGKKANMPSYIAAAATTQQSVLENFYAVPILEAPGYYVGNAQIRPDYSPGVSFLGINTRALVSSNYNY